MGKGVAAGKGRLHSFFEKGPVVVAHMGGAGGTKLNIEPSSEPEDRRARAARGIEALRARIFSQADPSIPRLNKSGQTREPIFKRILDAAGKDA
jgi:hypothetical protein